MQRQQKNTWQVVRSGVLSTSADSDLTATTSKWATALSNHTGNWLAVPPSSDRLEIRFRHSANNNNGTYSLWGFREKDDGVKVCTGLTYAGTQQATEQISSATTYHCDRITVANNYWHATPSSSCEDATNNNLRATLIVNTFGYKYFLVLLTAVSAGTVAVDMTHYKS